ncbi:MAG TPA: DUF427 domain-containing protein [Steroidobacteraceae bacterium]
MVQSPGHQRSPGHRIREQLVAERMTVEVHGEQLADSNEVIRVDEDGSPPRFYFPRDSVRFEKLRRSAHTTECPFKGIAHYFHLEQGDQLFENAVWSYESPYDEHVALRSRLAFDADRIPPLQVGRHR